MALLHWFPLNGDTKDYGLKPLTMTLQNAVVNNTNGKIGGNCYYNSSYSSGNLVSTEKTTLGQHQSMFCWMKFVALTSSSSLGGAMVGTHRYPNNTGMGLTLKYLTSSTGKLSVNTGNGSGRTYNTYTGNTTLNANVWYHVGFTYDGTTIRFYLNGAFDGSASYSGMSVPEDYLQIGAWSFSGSSGNTVYGGYHLNGYLNDVRVYNHTLSAKEVKEISKGLILHYNFEDEEEETTTNLTSGTTWSAYSSYWNISSQSDTEIKLVKNTSNSSPTVALQNSILKGKLSANTTITVSGYLYKGDTPYNTSVSNTTSYNSVTNISRKSRDDGYFEFTFKFGNLDSPWIIHTTLFGNGIADGEICYIRNLQWEFKDHATPFVIGTRTEKILDVSGYNNHGTVNGNLQISSSTGLGLHSLYIPNGVTDYVYNSSLRWPVDHITVQYWWKSSNTSPTGSYHIPVSSNSSGQYEMSISNGGVNRNGLYVAGARKVDNGTSNKLLNGQWHLISMTYDGATIKRYVDAVSEKDTAATGALSGGTGIMLGHYGTNTSYAVKEGYIADFKIYCTALKPAEILKEYQSMANLDKKYNLKATNFIENTNQKTYALLNQQGNFNTQYIEEFPSDNYTKIEYIENTGSSYIDTGISAKNKYFEIDLQFTSNGTRQLMGIGGSGSEYWGNNKGAWEKVGNSQSKTTLERVTVCYDVSNITTNRTTTWLKGSTAKYTGSSSTEANFNIYAGYTFKIFKLATSGYNCLMKLYDIKVFDANGYLVGHFVPAKRNSDSAVGMYDMFTGEFKTSSFTAGTEKNIIFKTYDNGLLTANSFNEI